MVRWRANKFFNTESRKILDSLKLEAKVGRGFPQNIVKEGLTRKIFRNKDLARRECGSGHGAFSPEICGASEHAEHCSLTLARGQ